MILAIANLFLQGISLEDSLKHSQDFSPQESCYKTGFEASDGFENEEENGGDGKTGQDEEEDGEDEEHSNKVEDSKPEKNKISAIIFINDDLTIDENQTSNIDETDESENEDKDKNTNDSNNSGASKNKKKTKQKENHPLKINLKEKYKNLQWYVPEI